MFTISCDQLRTFMDHSPMGYTYHQIICDQEGRPEDFVYLYVNAAFEKMTGLKYDDVIGKRWSDHFRKPEPSGFDWISAYGQIALHGGERIFEQYSAGLDKWFRVKVFSQEKTFFYTCVTDITNEIRIADSASAFLEASLEEIGYQAICDRAREISGAKYACFNLYDDQQIPTTMAVAASAEDLEVFTAQLGFPIIGKKWPHDPGRMERIAASEFTTFPSLSVFVGDKIPTATLNAIHNTFDMGELSVIKIMKGKDLLGDLTMIMPKGKQLNNEHLLKVYAHQVGLLLNRSKTEKALAESEERWQFALEGAGQGVWDIDLLTDQVFYSQQWKKMLGYDEDDLENTHATWTSLLHPDDRQIAFQRLEQYLLNPTATYESDFRLRCKDQSYRWILSRGKVVKRAQDGRPMRIIGTHTDISEQKREEQFRQTLLNAVPAPVFYKDAQGRYLGFNQAFEGFFGEKAENLIGKTVFEIPAIPQDLANTYHQKDQALLDNPGIQVYESQVMTTYGETRSVVFHKASFSWMGDEASGLIGVVLDITERKKMEAEIIKTREQAESASRAKTQFLSNMSHELRTPLNGIIGFTQLLMDTALSESQQEYLKFIQFSSNLLKDVVGNILDFTKIEAGKMQLHLSPTSLHGLCQQVIQILLFQALEKGIELSLSYDERIPEKVTIDGLRLEQVLLNLAGNAVKFTQHGYVRMKAKMLDLDDAQKKGTIRFEIEDTGIGISSEAVQRIFNTFEQADSSTTRQFGGTGLGLSIVMGLLDLMHTSLHVKSEPGKGSTFTFDLPVQWGEPDEGDAETPTLTQEPTLSMKHPNREIDCMVMLVEDDAFNLLLTKKMILRLLPSVHILEAAHGQEAIDLFKAHKPHLIFMDLAMPVMDGFSATKAIRELENDKEPHVPIIALTAAADHSSRDACFAAGMDDFITKPLSPSEFEELIRKWVNNLGLE